MSEKDWQFYHYNMLKRAQKILTIVKDDHVTQDMFLEGGTVYDALNMNLQIIGENASKLPEHVKERLPDIPWREVIFLRHVISHDYESLEDQTLWKTINEDISDLIAALETIKDYNEDEF